MHVLSFVFNYIYYYCYYYHFLCLCLFHVSCFYWCLYVALFLFASCKLQREYEDTRCCSCYGSAVEAASYDANSVHRHAQLPLNRILTTGSQNWWCHTFNWIPYIHSVLFTSFWMVIGCHWPFFVDRVCPN
jgi:hypothetical protein